MLLMVLTVAMASQAQRIIRYNQTPFHEDKYYIGASLTGLDINYSGLEDLKIGASGQLGYFVADDVMLYAEAGYIIMVRALTISPLVSVAAIIFSRTESSWE